MSGAGFVLTDWLKGAGFIRFWWHFAVLDIRLRYRRTILGPFWMTMSFGVSAAVLTFVYSTLFHVTTGSYFAYLITGLAVWGLVAGLMTEGCNTFIGQTHLVQQYRVPFLAHALRTVVVGFLAFLHNFLIVIVALAVFRVGFGGATLLVVPALVLILLNGTWMAMLLGMLCARFRDLPQVVALLVTVLFFVTPVFWYKDMLGARGYIVDLNPLYSFLELVRSPLLGHLPPAICVWVSLAVTVAGWLLTFLHSIRFESKLTYWV